MTLLKYICSLCDVRLESAVGAAGSFYLPISRLTIGMTSLMIGDPA